MTAMRAPPRLAPDGKPRRSRPTGDENGRSTIDDAEDPSIAGDAGEGGYANTDEATPDKDGLVRRGDQREPPLV